MTKTKKFIIGTLFSVVTLGGLVVYATPSEHFARFGKMSDHKVEFIINRVSSKLDLNEVQKQNLIALKDTVREQRKLHKPKNPRQELINLLSVPVLDETKILTLIEARTTEFNLAAPTVVTAIANFTNSLSNEQRQKMINIINNFSKRRGGHFGKHFGNTYK